MFSYFPAKYFVILRFRDNNVVRGRLQTWNSNSGESANWFLAGIGLENNNNTWNKIKHHSVLYIYDRVSGTFVVVFTTHKIIRNTQTLKNIVLQNFISSFLGARANFGPVEDYHRVSTIADDWVLYSLFPLW